MALSADDATGVGGGYVRDCVGCRGCCREDVETGRWCYEDETRRDRCCVVWCGCGVVRGGKENGVVGGGRLTEKR